MVDWEKTEDLLRAAETKLFAQQQEQAVSLASLGAAQTQMINDLGRTHLALLAIRDTIARIPMHSRRDMRPA